ncbi:MAG: DUF6702 family protein [Pyrinomonadaceae bacterium]
MKRAALKAIKICLERGFIFAFCLFTFYFAPQAAAHRFHTSLTRIDYNSEQKIYEISIQLFTHDLVSLFEGRGGKRVELEKSTEADKLIFDYIKENFVLTDKKGAAKNLKWIGKEADVDTIWVYLETPATENLEGYNLTNTIFFESFPEETNLVICRYEGKKADLMFKVGDKEKEIVENKPATEK